MILISKKNINRKFKTSSSLELSVERIEKIKNDMKKKKEDKDNNEIDLIRHEKKILLEKLILIFVIMIKD